MELWQPFCSAEWNHLCNFGSRYYEELFCEIILNLGLVQEEMSFKIFLIWCSGDLYDRFSKRASWGIFM